MCSNFYGTHSSFWSGRLLIKPSSLHEIKNSFDHLSLLQPSKVEYSHDWLELYKIAETTNTLFKNSELSVGPDEVSSGE
jgi:hypothetical protein